MELDQFATPRLALSDSTAFINDANADTPRILPTLGPSMPPDKFLVESLTKETNKPGSSLRLWPILTDEMAKEDRSMLCSVAYRLIIHFNKRDFDISEIDARIRCGFRQGRTKSEGCRVENEVLFAVLAEISS